MSRFSIPGVLGRRERRAGPFPRLEFAPQRPHIDHHLSSLAHSAGLIVGKSPPSEAPMTVNSFYFFVILSPPAREMFPPAKNTLSKFDTRESNSSGSLAATSMKWGAWVRSRQWCAWVPPSRVWRKGGRRQGSTSRLFRCWLLLKSLWRSSLPIVHQRKWADYRVDLIINNFVGSYILQNGF